MIPALFDLTGRHALVTGATGHLGRAISRALAESGAHVLVNGRDAVTTKNFVAELGLDGLSAEAACFDVCDATAVATHAQSREGKPLHILINNAYSGGGGTAETSEDSAFRDAYEIGLVAAQRMLKSHLPGLRQAVREDSDASVVNVASMYGVVSPDLRTYNSPSGSNPPFYGATKAALIQFTRYAACEFGHEGIRVNALAPGPFPNPKVQQEASGFVSQLVKKVPLGRIGQAGDIGGPMVFLASPAASFVTGTVLKADGGWTAW